MTDDGNIDKLPRAERTAITLAMAKVADAITTSSEQRARVIAELVHWVSHRANGSTWDCEAAGLRLRGGQSLPGWCTADYRGKLLAVKIGARPAQGHTRALLVKRLADVAAECYGKPLAWHGSRVECVNIGHFPIVMTSLSPDGKASAAVVEHHWADVMTRRVLPNAKWHLPRTRVLLELPGAQVHMCGDAYLIGIGTSGVLYEAGSGPVAFGMTDRDLAEIVVVPSPDATQQQINKQVAGIGASYREWCRRATRPFKRHALRVIKFEDVGEDKR